MSTAQHPPGQARPGGRTARTRAAVLAAVFDELGDKGFAALTMEGVAQRSGVHQATIYRRWRTVEVLVCALLTERSAAIPVPDTGTLCGDLRALARGIGVFYGDARNRAMIEAVVSAAGRDPRAEEALREFFDDRLGVAGVMVRRALERGELPPGTDAEAVVGALGAPFYYRMLLVRRPVDLELVEQATFATYAAARAGAYVRTGEPPTGEARTGKAQIGEA
ncbi:TetR/AcrR family transcriptional regulator [Streptomyces purpurogeneiscleroticus]|uniref:TetR/AcrR family transcriptional regulator n=1 Tax=Streptomyces purpurogeneiscleroticus TaxID=68259 RepID=UPI001CC04C24|nr:TetR/AcrR family transcriptional regulator [Streptomyces purpurogeneiscleroticus]MBZ4019565.1 TetR family transcriptional regulator [Streptomyces purpurogeneiscleroticus]